MEPQETKKGFCYVATTEGYLDEALQSIESLKKWMPLASIAVFTQAELFGKSPLVDRWIECATNLPGPAVKIQIAETPFERSIFLDTDTRVTGDLSDLFTILDRFDIAAAHEPTRGWDYDTPAGKAFCELNTGVIAFKSSPAMSAFFSRWQANYESIRQEQGLANDQPSFRKTAWESEGIRLAVLPSEYHFIVGKPMSIAWEAKLLHGRHDLAVIERVLNEQVGYRAFVQGLGCVRGFSGMRGWLTTLFKINWSWLRYAFGIGRSEKTPPVKWQQSKRETRLDASDVHGTGNVPLA